MHKLFLISAKMPEDFCFYEQVFREAGFQCVFSRDEDELLLCDAALLYGDADTAADEECHSLIGFCRRRSIPLLIIHDDSRYPREEGVYSAFHTTMPEFMTILYPPKEKEPELSPVQKKILNTFMILFILVPVLLFAYRICIGADGTVLPEEKSAERETVLLVSYGTAAAEIYTISSFGDTIYRGSGYAVSDANNDVVRLINYNGGNTATAVTVAAGLKHPPILFSSKDAASVEAPFSPCLHLSFQSQH